MSHPFARFERIFIINLASRADRRQEMSEQLSRVGLSADSEQIRFFNAVRPTEAEGFPTIGTRGAFMSHLGVLRQAVAEGLERILILEDDVNFSQDFVPRATALMQSLEGTKFDMFYGGYELHDAMPPMSENGWVRLPAAHRIQNAHFIGFEGRAIAAVERYLSAILERAPGDPEGGPMHVDGAYSWFRRAHPLFETVLAVPELGHQRASRTDIHELAWYDKMPGVREIVATVRRARNAR
jgi:glycosyl transferase family 25